MARAVAVEELPLQEDSGESELKAIYTQLKQIEKGVHDQDNRYILRVLLILPKTRRKLQDEILRGLAEAVYPDKSPELEEFLTLLPPIGKQAASGIAKLPSAPTQQPIEAVDAFLHLLVLVYCIDRKQLDKAEETCERLMKRVVCHSGHSLDLIGSKVYYFYSITAELNNRLAEIRPFLMRRLRCATLRNDFEAQAVLINCLLRNYIHYALYGQAEKFANRCNFPASANNNEHARYLYYLGRIEVVKLNYTAAQKHLQLALRKAPQRTGVGFRQAVQKLEVVVHLLLGNIPERQLFRDPVLRRPLAPYFQLAQAVRLGDVQRFGEVVENYGSKFQADKTHTLIMRLRHNVIKTALRTMASAYSCISLCDIAKILLLDSTSEAEYVVAKAIRDGVIEAHINLQEQCMCTKDTGDVYCTSEPARAYNERISFCLNLHNDSMKAMRYPAKDAAKDESELKLEQEVHMDMDDDDWFELN